MKLKLGAVIIAVAAVCAVGANAQERSRGAANFNRDCVQELRRGDPFANAASNRLSDIARECRRVSLDARVGGVRAARARFYAGRAYRMLGDGEEAIRNLVGAVSAGPDFSSAEFGAELRAATLELIQAYRESDRVREAREMLDRTGPGSLSQDDPAVAYQRAMLVLEELGEESQAGMEGAFTALRPVFTRTTASLNPPLTAAEIRAGIGSSAQPRLSVAEIRNGRAWLFRLGDELGQRALDAQRDTRDRAQSVIQAQRAIEYLTAATSAVLESGWNIGAPENGTAPTLDEMSDVFFKLGNAKLRAAGVLPRRNGPDLDCLGGERTLSAEAVNQFRQARDAFNAIRENPNITAARRADAHWGLGCATLAGLDPSRNFESDLQTAIGDLRVAVGQGAQGSAAPGQSDRPEYLLTLARALFIQGAGEAARTNYRNALTALSGDTYQELRSEIQVDIARTYLFSACRAQMAEARNCISFRNPSPIDLSDVSDASGQAQRALEQSLATNRNGDARLMLAQIYLQQRKWVEARTQLTELLSGQSRLEEGDPRKALARYLSSRRETLIRQTCLRSRARNDDGRTCGGNGEIAVADATRASVNDQTNGDYRRQACIARILFGRTEDEQYCLADSGRDEQQYAQALLFEGMYWLRRAHSAPQGVRQDRWGLSINAFERGLPHRSAGDMPTIYPEGISRERPIYLNELLRYGERYVRVCAIGRAGDNETASEDVKEYFRLSGMLPCLVRN